MDSTSRVASRREVSVRSEISKEGVLYYEFPEVRHRRELGSGS